MSQAQLALYDMMRGPFDRQDHHKAFAVNIERPEGAGFYPSYMTKEFWDSYLEKHPEDKDKLENLVTMVLGNHIFYNEEMQLSIKNL